MSINQVYADYHARQRKDRIVSAVIISALLLSTHVTVAIFGAYVWHLVRGC